MSPPRPNRLCYLNRQFQLDSDSEEESESEDEDSDDFLSDDEVKVIAPLSPEVKGIFQRGAAAASKKLDETIEGLYHVM